MDNRIGKLLKIDQTILDLAKLTGHERATDGKYDISGNGRPHRRCCLQNDGGVDVEDQYSGPHSISYDKASMKITIKKGFVLQNGQFVEESADTLIDPQSGIICVTNTLGQTGWGTPVLKFDTPSALAYPIGKCTVEGSGSNMTVKLECYHQPVAFLFVVGDCEE